jgi:hypothetical protein
MTVQPQKQRANRSSNKWTKPAETRSSTPSKQMESQEPTYRFRGNLSSFLIGTAATACHKTNNKQLQDEDTTVCSNETHSTLHQQTKERKRCKPTAMMRHRMWLKGHSPNNNNQTTSPSQTEGRNKLSQPTSQCVQKPRKTFFGLIRNNNKTKKTQNSRRGSSPIKLKTKTNKPRQKHITRTLIARDMMPTSYQPASSALRYALLRSNKRYKPGD